MRDFHRLDVTPIARRLVRETYRVTAYYPDDERFGLVSQARRAATSIACNIAEGCGRSTDRELARFLDVAGGSVSELQMLWILSLDLKIADPDTLRRAWRLTLQEKKMLASLTSYLRYA